MFNIKNIFYFLLFFWNFFWQVLLSVWINDFCTPFFLEVRSFWSFVCIRRSKRENFVFCWVLFWVGFLWQSLNRVYDESIYSSESQRYVWLPSTRKVSFTAQFEIGSRVQVSKDIRWQFQIEPTQIFKMGVQCKNNWNPWQHFYDRVGKDGRIHVPKLHRSLILRDFRSTSRPILGVTIEPA